MAVAHHVSPTGLVSLQAWEVSPGHVPQFQQLGQLEKVAELGLPGGHVRDDDGMPVLSTAAS